MGKMYSVAILKLTLGIDPGNMAKYVYELVNKKNRGSKTVNRERI